jgi:hypothetical protein
VLAIAKHAVGSPRVRERIGGARDGGSAADVVRHGAEQPALLRALPLEPLVVDLH